MKAEYFSDLSISKKVREQIINEAGEIENLERNVDYKKVTFYIPKEELVRAGINFDEYSRYASFDIYPSGSVPMVTSEDFVIPEHTRQAMKRGVEAMKTGIAVLEDILTPPAGLI